VAVKPTNLMLHYPFATNRQWTLLLSLDFSPELGLMIELFAIWSDSSGQAPSSLAALDLGEPVLRIYLFIVQALLGRGHGRKARRVGEVVRRHDISDSRWREWREGGWVYV
jgi:hypothetical protein